MKINTLLIVLLMSALICNAEDSTGPTHPDGYIGGHAYVDLGLPSGTLWAVSNVGADSEYESGGFFAWGETEPKELYNWETYRYFIRFIEESGDNEPWIELEDIGYSICGTEYDAATANWGGGWAMPDSIQCEEMRKYTFSKRVVENGVEGVRVYSTVHEGKSIFFGDYSDGYTGDLPDHAGLYWSGVSISAGSCSWMRPTGMASFILTQRYSHKMEWSMPAYKCAGYCVRPVIKKGAGIIDTGIFREGVSLSVAGRVISVDSMLPDGILKITDFL